MADYFNPDFWEEVSREKLRVIGGSSNLWGAGYL
jgi:hypothetical protein